VSADGRTDLVSVRHERDDRPDTVHVGAVDAAGRVVATASLFVVPCPARPDARPAVQLTLMAVEPAEQRRGIGSAVLAEAIRRVRGAGAVLLWADARDSAVPFYERYGFRAVPASEFTPPQTGSPHRVIELRLDDGAGWGMMSGC
jgi:predicted N-acetyltransferase YhbS